VLLTIFLSKLTLSVSPDNNGSERAIIDTAIKNNQNVLQTLSVIADYKTN